MKAAAGKQQENPISDGLLNLIRPFLILFLPVALFIGALVWGFYFMFITNQREMAASQDADMILLQKESIDRDFQMIVADALFLAQQSALHEAVGGIEPGEWVHLATDYLAFSSRKQVYDQVRFIDTKGMERVRVNFNDGEPAIVPEEGLQDKSQRYYFRDTVGLGYTEVFVSPFDLNIEHGQLEQPLKPMIRFGTPVVDPDGNKRGIIVLNYLGRSLIDNFIRTHVHHPDRSSLVNSQGYWLHNARTDLEWGFMFADGKQRTFGNAFPQEWQQIITSDAGQLLTENGMFNYTTVYPLIESWKSSTGAAEAFKPSARLVEGKEYFWKIISHTTPEALDAAVTDAANTSLQIYALLLLAAGGGCLLLLHFRERHRLAEAALKQSELDLAEAQHLAKIGNWNLDLVNNALMWSNEIYHIFEIDAQQFDASYEAFLSAIHPEDREMVNQAYTDSLEDKQSYDIEHRLLMPDGSLKWVHEHCETIYDDNGAPIRSIGTVQDITERKKEEAYRENLLSELKAKNKELEQFAYSVSHDLKTPMITIRGFLSRLEQDIADGNSSYVHDDVQRIASATTKMQEMLEDVLELSRIGRIVNPFAQVSLSELALEAVDAFEEQIVRDKVQIDVDGELPVVNVDRARLLQVYQNLIANALFHAGKKDGLLIEVGSEERGNEAVFFVRDNGIGIESRFHQTIFGLFEKLDTKSGGTGVGLALCRNIVEAHGGRIWVESEGEGKGAGFYFTLGSKSRPN